MIRSIRAIENSDVCVLMLDATRGIESQDMNIFSLVQKNKKGLVVCVNKWDLIEDKSQKVIDSYTTAIREASGSVYRLPDLVYLGHDEAAYPKGAGDRQGGLRESLQACPYGQVERGDAPDHRELSSPAWKGKYIKIKYITQLPAGSVPSFVFFCNLPQWIKDPYKRFLENKIRENWDFTGTPINIFIREK